MLYLQVLTNPVPWNNHFYAIDTAFEIYKFRIHQQNPKYRAEKMVALIHKDNSVLVQGHTSNLHISQASQIQTPNKLNKLIEEGFCYTWDEKKGTSTEVFAQYSSSI